MMLTDAQTEWHNRMGPCPDCGDRIDYSDSECRDMIEVDDRLMADSPGLRRTINNMTVRCFKCDMRREQERRDAELGGRVYRLRIDTFARELLPKSCLDVSFDKSNRTLEGENSDAYDWARKGFSGNLWLHGERGTGKTYLARCCLKREMMAGYSVAEIKAKAVAEASRELHTEKTLHRYTETRWLLLDDIDKMEITERSVLALFDLVDKRLEHKGRLLITSNPSPAKVHEAFQAVMRGLKNETIVPALFDRFHPLVARKFTGTSHRRATE